MNAKTNGKTFRKALARVIVIPACCILAPVAFIQMVAGCPDPATAASAAVALITAVFICRN